MQFFPEIVTRHPAADLGLAGAESHLLQAGDQQIAFMSFDRDVDVPEHAHAAQWGVVLDGEIELTIAGDRRVFRKGDSYFIPAGVRHSSRIRAGYKDMTLFDQRDRYPVLARAPASEAPGDPARGLSPLGGGALAALSERLGEGDERVRIETVIALGASGAAALPYLARALNDPAERVRRQTVSTLGAIGAPALSLLAQGLADPAEPVRRLVVDSLAAIGTPARAALQVAAGDAAPAVSLPARRALEALG